MERIGYGLMQLAGKGVWGPPPVWTQAVEMVRLAYGLGVRIFDTAWYYGPYVTNQLLAEALLPYPRDLTIVTKAGNSRGPDRSWRPALEPEDLRRACEVDLKLLRLETLPLVLLRWQPQEADAARFLSAIATLIALRSEGKVRNIGLSNVELRHVIMAREVVEVTAVSNSFSVYSRRDVEVLDYCTRERVMYMPYYPLLGGDAVRQPLVEKIARDMGVTPAQIALAWLLAQSPMMVPIPGTSRVEHLRQNMAAADLTIPAPQLTELNKLGHSRSL